MEEDEQRGQEEEQRWQEALKPEEAVTMNEDEQRWQEALKLEYDWHKHMTTLSAGIPIIFAALVTSNVLFPNKLLELKLLVASLGLLVGSIFFSLLSMVIAVRYMRRGPFQSGTTRATYFGYYRALTIFYSVVGFLGGIVFFLFFASQNY